MPSLQIDRRFTDTSTAPEVRRLIEFSRQTAQLSKDVSSKDPNAILLPQINLALAVAIESIAQQDSNIKIVDKGLQSYATQLASLLDLATQVSTDTMTVYSPGSVTSAKHAGEELLKQLQVLLNAQDGDSGFFYFAGGANGPAVSNLQAVPQANGRGESSSKERDLSSAKYYIGSDAHRTYILNGVAMPYGLNANDEPIRLLVETIRNLRDSQPESGSTSEKMVNTQSSIIKSIKEVRSSLLDAKFKMETLQKTLKSESARLNAANTMLKSTQAELVVEEGKNIESIITKVHELTQQYTAIAGLYTKANEQMSLVKYVQ